MIWVFQVLIFTFLFKSFNAICPIAFDFDLIAFIDSGINMFLI